MGSEDYALAEPIRVIVNLKNNGVTVYNVTECMGSLNDVDDFSHYRQNVAYLLSIRFVVHGAQFQQHFVPWLRDELLVCVWHLRFHRSC